MSDEPLLEPLLALLVRALAGASAGNVWMDVPPLPEGCPWSGFALPNLKWCEDNLCGWITAPANTWSNLAYLGFALPMWQAARGRGFLRPFAPASVAVGTTSFVYHASYTFLFQFFDFVGMFLFAALPISMNAVRLGWIREPSRGRVYAALVLGCSALVPILFRTAVPIQGIVAVLVLAAVAQELRLWLGGGGASRAWWLVAVALLAAAATSSALDLSRVWCDPGNHWLQGHAVWHVLSAASLWALFRFYSEVDAVERGPRGSPGSAQGPLRACR
jgi:hypothetical protein